MTKRTRPRLLDLLRPKIDFGGFAAVAVVILFLAAFYVHHSPQTITSRQKDSFGIPQSPMEVRLSISDPPALGEQAELRVSIASSVEAPGTEVQVSVPDGFELVSGRAFWTVDLRSGQEQQFALAVKAVKEGSWTISASGKHTVRTSPVYWFGDRAYLDLQVGRMGGTLGISPSQQEEFLIDIPQSR